MSASDMQGGGTSPIQRHGLQESYGDGAQDLFACVDSRGTGTNFNASTSHLFLHNVFARNVQASTSIIELQINPYSPPLVGGASSHIYCLARSNFLAITYVDSERTKRNCPSPSGFHINLKMTTMTVIKRNGRSLCLEIEASRAVVMRPKPKRVQSSSHALPEFNDL